MSFKVIIPARMSSTRLPNKPLALIGGYPMVVRVAKQAQKSLAKQVIVTSDSEAIAKECKQHGVEFVFSAATHQSGTDRIAEVCQKLALKANEIIVNVQGDEPLIPPDLINAVAKLLQENESYQMATAAHPLTEKSFADFNTVKVVINKQKEALYFSRAAIPSSKQGVTGAVALAQKQNKEFSLLKHIGIYAYRADFLQLFPRLEEAPLEIIESLEQLRAMWHGYKIAVTVYHNSLPPGVDTADDLAAVRKLVEG